MSGGGGLCPSVSLPLGFWCGGFLLVGFFFAGKGQDVVAEFYWNFCLSEELPQLKRIFLFFFFCLMQNPSS